MRGPEKKVGRAHPGECSSPAGDSNAAKGGAGGTAFGWYLREGRHLLFGGFLLRFAFFGQTRADIRLRILEGRRTRLEERLDGVRAAMARTRERLDSYTLELHRHGLESVEREVRWLNELIASERQAGGDRGRQSQPPGDNDNSAGTSAS